MQQLWGYLIDVRNMHDCYIKFDFMRISLIRGKYWYEIRDVWYSSRAVRKLVPILHGVNYLKCEIYGSSKHLDGKWRSSGLIFLSHPHTRDIIDSYNMK